MATQSIPNSSSRQELENLLGQWETRWRWRRVILYLPRVMMVALGLGLIVGLVVGLFRLLPPMPMLVLVGIVIGVTGFMLSAAIGLWSKGGIEAARRFDALFGLQERLSTAFELLDGRIKTVDELAAMQLADTSRRAREIDAEAYIHFEVKWLEWVGVLLLVMLLIVGVGGTALLNSQGAGMGAETQAAINAAADTASDVQEMVATDSSLTDEERSALLESTEATLAELQNPDTTAEDSFAAMSELAAELQSQAEALREDINQSENALQNASEALGTPDGLDFSPNANGLGQQLGDWQTAMEAMTPEQQAALANRLEDAADAVAEENPELAESLQDAADALNQGDEAAAATALSTAQQQSNNAARQNADRNQSAENIEQAAADAQESSQDISTSEYNENAQADGQIDPNSTIEEQLGMEEPEIPSAAGEEGGGGSGDEPSEGQSGDLVESSDPNAREGNTEGQSQGESEQNDGEGRGEESREGGGAGDGQAPEGSETERGGLSQEASTDNNADGQGETNYESIYTPFDETINRGQTNVQLESDSSGQPSVEGDFQDNPTGASRLPYNQVFSSYSDEANRALENDYVPLGVRDVVRDYFTSIEPTGGGD